MTLHLAIFWFVVHFYCKTRATIYKFCPFLTLPCNAFLGLLGREKIPYKYNSYPNPNLLNSAMEECPRWKFFRGETAVKGQFLSVEFLQLQANTSASSRLSPTQAQIRSNLRRVQRRSRDVVVSRTFGVVSRCLGFV